MIRLARKLAETMHGQKYVVVAQCFSDRGELISTAGNSYSKSHPYQARLSSRLGIERKTFLHAEVRAILGAKGKSIHKICTFRFNRAGQTVLAKPCRICEEAIKEAGIKIVEYTT